MKRKFIVLISVLIFVVAVCFVGCTGKNTKKEDNIKDDSFYLDTYSVSLIEGGQYYVTASIGNENVVWKSNDVSIAEVEKGVIKGKSKGETDIIVTKGNDTAICHVVVNEKNYIIPTLSVYTNSTSLFVNKKLAINSSFTLNNQPVDSSKYVLNYSSDNEEVANVENGHIVGLKEGKANIKVYCLYEGMYFEEIIKVSVANASNYFELGTKLYSLAFGKTLSGKENKKMTSGKLDCKVFIEDEEQDYKDVDITFTSKNVKVVTVDEDGNITPTGIGKTEIAISYGNTEYSVKVNVGTPMSSKEDFNLLSNAYKNSTDKSSVPDEWKNDKVYVLTNNVDFGNDNFYAIASIYRANDGDGRWWMSSGYAPLNSAQEYTFSGTIDGAGYAIKNIELTPVWAQWNNLFYKGANFIGHLSGTLENISFENVSTFGSNGTPVQDFGLIGYLRSGAKVQNIYVEEDVDIGKFASNAACLAAYWNYDYGQGDNVSVKNVIMKVHYGDWQPVTTYGQTSTKVGLFIESPNSGRDADIQNCYVVSDNMTMDLIYGCGKYITKIYKTTEELFNSIGRMKFTDDGFADFIIDKIQPSA